MMGHIPLSTEKKYTLIDDNILKRIALLYKQYETELFANEFSEEE